MDQGKQQRLAEYLNRQLLWHRSPHWYGNTSPFGMASVGAVYEPRPPAEQLAREFLADAEFQSFRLGTWLATPEGEVFAQAVEMVMPPFYRQDAELLVEALKIAAKLQQRNERLAGGIVIGAVLVLGLGFGRGGAATAA